MSKKKKRKSAPHKPAQKESRTAEAATVFWMTTLLATLLGEVAALLAWLVMVLTQPLPALELLSMLLLLIATVTGLLCLGLTPVVLRVRRVPPPRTITRFAVAASLVPIATLTLALLFRP